MQRYLVERVVQLAVVLVFLSMIVFTIVRLIPGDPAAVMLGTEATPQAMAEIRHEMGLDQPLPVQYALWLRWLPPSGYLAVTRDPLGALRVTLLPALTLGVALAAPLTRFLRSGMLDVLGLDYVRTARAKGLGERVVVARHALGNALLS